MGALRALHLNGVHAHLNRLEWLRAARPVSLSRRGHWEEAIVVFVWGTDVLLLEGHLLVLRILAVLINFYIPVIHVSLTLNFPIVGLINFDPGMRLVVLNNLILFFCFEILLLLIL